MNSAGPLEVLTVSQLNRQAKQLLESRFSPVWVEGEISSFKHHTSGHMYFVLKDDRSELAVVMFASFNLSLTFKPANGQKVLARGDLTLYEARGQYQLVVQHLYPSGAGELWLAYEALKGKLKAEGLFDPARKRSLPAFPRRIGVVTSPAGAAIQDIIQVMGRRAPHVILVIRPTQVQGEGAAEDIANGIEEFGTLGGVDLVVLARGGGSLEDLWPFNEERVARAVAACPLPTLSAVGHETDITICDLVADQRAPTPSAAAELATPDRDGYLQFLDERAILLERYIRRRVSDYQRQLAEIQQRYAFRQPLVLLHGEKDRLSQLADNLRVGFAHLVEQKTNALGVAQAALHALNPEGILRRGYVIVTDDETGKVIMERRELKLKQALTLRLIDGTAGVEVTRLGED